MVTLFSSARSGDGSNRCGGAGTHGERTVGSDNRTSGRTSSPSDDPAIASQRHRGKPKVACLQSPPRSPSPNHPRDVAGNPDASRCFVGHDSDRPAPHGSPDRGAGLVAPPAGHRAAPSVHSLVRSKSGRDHSGCRREPELGSARTETAGQSSPPRATAQMDAIGNDWNTAPACVLGTVWGTASIRDLAVEVGAVPASPIRQVLTSRQAGCAWPQSSARASLWICGQHKSVAHKPTGTTAATENLNNLEISSVRTTPGSPSQAALNATMHGCYDLSAIYTRVLIAVHRRPRVGWANGLQRREPQPAPQCPKWRRTSSLEVESIRGSAQREMEQAIAGPAQGFGQKTDSSRKMFFGLVVEAGRKRRRKRCGHVLGTSLRDLFG